MYILHTCVRIEVFMYNTIIRTGDVAYIIKYIYIYIYIYRRVRAVTLHIYLYASFIR